MKAGLAAPWRASGDYRHDARRSHSPTVAVFIMSDFRCIGLKGAFLSAIHGKTLALAFALYFHAMATGPVHAAAPIISAHPLLSIAFAPTTGSEPTLFQSAALLGTIVNVMPNAASFATSSSIVDAVAVVAAQRAVPPSGELATVWIGRIAGLIALAALFVVRLQPLASSRSLVAFLLRTWFARHSRTPDLVVREQPISGRGHCSGRSFRVRRSHGGSDVEAP